MKNTADEWVIQGITLNTPDHNGIIFPETVIAKALEKFNQSGNVAFVQLTPGNDLTDVVGRVTQTIIESSPNFPPCLIHKIILFDTPKANLLCLGLESEITKISLYPIGTCNLETNLPDPILTSLTLSGYSIIDSRRPLDPKGLEKFQMG